MPLAQPDSQSMRRVISEMPREELEDRLVVASMFMLRVVQSLGNPSPTPDNPLDPRDLIEQLESTLTALRTQNETLQKTFIEQAKRIDQLKKLKPKITRSPRIPKVKR